MKHMLRWALPALLVSSPLAAAAAEPPPFRIGIGGSVDVGGFALTGDSQQLAFVPSGFANVMVPIWIGSLRIEPEIGYVTYENEEKTSFQDESFTERFTNSAFRIGTGVAWSWEVAERTRVYAGPRFGLIFRSTERERPTFEEEQEQATTEITATDFWVGLSLGGEAFLTPAFSLGVEAQMNYVDFGEPDVDVKPAPEPDPDPENTMRRSIDESLLSTQVLVSARIYFM